jgi:hypothetical protein
VFGRAAASGGLLTMLKVWRIGVWVKTNYLFRGRLGEYCAAERGADGAARHPHPMNVNSCQCKLFLYRTQNFLLEEMDGSDDGMGR